jgi:hypothetical protein
MSHALKGICLALLAICGLQAFSALAEGDPLAGLEDSLALPPPPSQTAVPPAPASASSPGTAPATPPSPPAADRYTLIQSSGILGAPPQGPPPPALLGFAGDYAIIRNPEGQSDLVKEGGTLGSVKVLRIGINRVLIEHKGKVEELSIFEGLGGQPLVPGKEASTR